MKLWDYHKDLFKLEKIVQLGMQKTLDFADNE